MSRRPHSPEPWYWPDSAIGRAAIITGVVVAVFAAIAVAVNRVPAPPKMWTEREVQDRFLLRSMDEIRGELGPASFTSTDSAGNIACLRYYRVPVAPDGRERNMYFFARGNRCDQCGFDGPP